MVNPTKRARTEEQKQARRRTILSAAEAHLADVGFESFSMVALARVIEMGKGTLYIYFETRDHLLLALFCEKLEYCSTKFIATLPETVSDHEFASVYNDILSKDPVYLLLASLWLGTAQSGSGPSVDEQVIPQKIKQVMEQYSARNLFISNACRILHGIRSDV